MSLVATSCKETNGKLRFDKNIVALALILRKTILAGQVPRAKDNCNP
jgi:hypothetical protein